MWLRIVSKMRLDARLFARVGALTLLAVFAESVSADQFVVRHKGREVVVHTSPIPVFLHRLVPPNYGRHVTLKEYQASRRNDQPTTIQSVTPIVQPRQDSNKPSSN